MTQHLNHFINLPSGPTMLGPNNFLTNIVAHWSMDEASGATRNDSFSTNHLLNNGTVGQAAGLISFAADFNGVNANYLSIGDNTALSMGDIDFVIACHVYLNSVSGTQIFMNKGSSVGSAGNEFQLYFSTTLRFSVGNGTTGTVVNSGVVPIASTWYSLIAWHDATADVIGIAVNNATAVTVAHSVGSYNSTFEMALGRWSNGGGGSMNGRIDLAAIWKNRLFSINDRSRYHNGGAGLAYAAYL
jgi:hypothetical protein